MPLLERRSTEESGKRKSSFGGEEIGEPLCSRMMESASPYENGLSDKES